jgi:hypothetical protein
MANISQIKKVSRVVTQDEFDNDFNIIIEVLWDSPFYDTNYVIALSADTSATVAGSQAIYSPLSVTNVTPQGFTAVLPQEGDSPVGTIVLHAMATHL